jgi:adenylate cyclase
MTPDQVKRKLAAILSADVKGYSRLMEADEEGTIRTLKAYIEVISGFIQQHRGRVVATGGDSVLAEFASVVDAVRCAVGIQEELKERNKDVEENRRMEFRIGVNLGDVVEDDDTILGDGVNIAARVQSLAEAGGICITGTAYDQIKNKLAVGYEYTGEQTVKNIKEPVKIYRVLMEPGTKVPEVASKEKMAFPLPDKPSIAVLPFTNISGEKKEEYFCDGLAEGIIDGLSKSEQLFVIARNSTFTYKGKAVKVQQVAEEMGVQYVMEGSVQREGKRVRITAQLVDALTGHHLFSERYDRDLKDILNLQDEITMRVLTAVQVKLTVGVWARITEKGTKNLDAYLKVLQANELKASAMNKEVTQQVMQLAEEAIALDPGYAIPYSLLSISHFELTFLGASQSPKESLQKAVELGKKAIALDDSNTYNHSSLVFPYTMLGELDKAISEAEKSVSLAPNSPTGYYALGTALSSAGRPQEAIPMLQKCLRLSPIPVHSEVLGVLARSYAALGQYEEAVATYKKMLQRYGPDHISAHIWLASTYAVMDREKEACAEGAEVLRIDPKFSFELWVRGMPLDQLRKDGWIKLLRKAGLN